MRHLKIAVIIGTRPEIIKMFPVILACRRRRLDYFILHTGQHYDENLDAIFFKEFRCPLPRYNLKIGSGTAAAQVGKMLIGLENVMQKEAPDICLVQGDTATALAGALAANQLHIPVGHIEAGLRSFDRAMPEEINRILADQLSDFLFAPTALAKEHLIKSGAARQSVFVTGNTIADVVEQFKATAKKHSQVLTRLNLKKGGYFLATIHRQENADSPKNFRDILQTFGALASLGDFPVVYPIHPRSAKRLTEFNLKIPANVLVIEPLGFFDFLNLEMKAKVILTDSGGVQEEACILGVPCVTLRENTERQETVAIGANHIAGRNSRRVCGAVKKCLERQKRWRHPFGDGKAGERIVELLLAKL